MTDSPGRHYRAFISYSHQDNRSDRRDGSRGRVRWADWLHDALESFEVPVEVEATRIALGPERRLHPVFKDEDELPVSPDLGGSIEDALVASDALIVICSPRSAASLYCNEEVRIFKALGRADRILPLIVAGEPGAAGRQQGSFAASEECFPAALRFALDDAGRVLDGEPDREPICADARDPADGTEPSATDWDLDQDGQQRVLLKLVAGILGVSFDALAQRDRRRRMERERARARAAATGLYATALREFQRGEAGDAAAYLAASLRTHAETSAPRLMALAMLDDRGASDLGGRLRGAASPLLCCAANSAFTRIAYGTLDGRVGIASLPDRTLTREYPLAEDDPVIRIAWGPNDDHLRVITWAGAVHTLHPGRMALAMDDVASGAPRRYESLPEAVLDPEGPGTDFAGSSHGIWFDYAQQPAWRGPRYRASVQIFAVHPAAEWFAAVVQEGVHLYDCRTFEQLTDTPLFSGQDRENGHVCALTLDAGGERIAIGCADGTLCLVDVGLRERTTTRLDGNWNDDAPMALAFDATGADLFVGTRAGRGLALRSSDLACQADRQLHDGPLTIARWSPDGGTLVTGGDDGAVAYWTLPGLDAASVPSRHDRGIAEIVLDPTGERIVSVAHDGSMRLTRRLGGGESFAERRRLAASAFALGGEVIAWASEERTIGIATTDGTQLREFPFTGVGEFGRGTLLGGGERLLLSVYEQFRDEDGVIRSDRTRRRAELIDLADGHAREVLGDAAWRHGAAENGDRILYTLDRRSLRLLDLASGETRALDFVAPQDIGQLILAPDGDVALVAFGHGESRLVDTGTGAVRHELPTQPHPVMAAGFDRVHGVLAIGAEEIVSIVDLDTGELVVEPIMTGSENIEALAFSPDGELLFVGGWGYAALHDARIGAALRAPFDTRALGLSIVRDARFNAAGSELLLVGERMGGPLALVALAVPEITAEDGPVLADLLEATHARTLNGNGVTVDLRDDGALLTRLADAEEARRDQASGVQGLLQRYGVADEAR